MSLVDPTLDLAIHSALAGDWVTAIETNQKLLTTNPHDIGTLNRLAKAYLENGDLNEARHICLQVLKLDPYNQIAGKTAIKIKLLLRNKSDGTFSAKQPLLSQRAKLSPDSLLRQFKENDKAQALPTLFLEEPGKTKVVSCLKPATPQQLSLQKPGSTVYLVLKRHTIVVVDNNKQYLGILPDELSHHLNPLIRGGNEYEAYVKSVNLRQLTVFLREKTRAQDFAGTPSFPTTPTKTFFPSVRPEGIRAREESNPLEEYETDETEPTTSPEESEESETI